MLCGSLPPGVPADFYAQLIARAGRTSKRCSIPMAKRSRAASKPSPTVVTPNQQEAERLLNTVLLTRSKSPLPRRDGFAHGRGVGRAVARQPRRDRRVWQGTDDVGSDSAAHRGDLADRRGRCDGGGVAWSLKTARFPEALSWGVATGTASAQLPGIQFATLEPAARSSRGRGTARRVERVPE